MGHSQSPSRRHLIPPPSRDDVSRGKAAAERSVPHRRKGASKRDRTLVIETNSPEISEVDADFLRRVQFAAERMAADVAGEVPVIRPHHRS